MSLPKYPEYKDSGVSWLGEVPAHWELKPLRHVATINDEALPETTDADYKIEYVDIGSVTLSGGIERTESFLFESAPSRARRVVKHGDIIVSTVRTYLKAIAPISYPVDNLIVSTGFAVVRPGRYFASSFAKYFLQSNFFVDEVISRSVGVSYPAINASDLNSICLLLPKYEEQEVIANFLDRETAKIDALIAEQEKLIALLAEKRQATISRAVTRGLDPNVPLKDSGVPWLGKVPAHWDLKRIKHIKSSEPNAFVDGPFGSNLKSEHFVEEGDVFVIESNFATQGRLDEAELKKITLAHFETISRSEVVSGDIVIAKIGAQFGKASILPDLTKRAVISGNSLKLTVNGNICSQGWVYYQLVNLKFVGEIDLLANGSAQPALSLGGMNTLPVLIPPCAEQLEIINFIKQELSRLNLLNESAKKTIMLLTERRAALISAAVTGKIDVRGLAA